MGGSWGALGWILGVFGWTLGGLWVDLEGLWVRTKTETQNSSHQLPCSHFGSSPGAPWWTYCGITRGITRREPGTSLTYTSGSALTLLLVDRLTATSSSITLQSPEGTWSSRFLATLDSGCWVCARLTERGSGPVMGGGNGCRGMALLRGGGGMSDSATRATSCTYCLSMGAWSKPVHLHPHSHTTYHLHPFPKRRARPRRPHVADT